MGKIIIKENVVDQIDNFYINVMRKYGNTVSINNVDEWVEESYSLISQIGDGKFGKKILRNKISDVVPEPSNDIDYRVQLCKSKSIQWYFIYYIENDTIYIVNAIHGQNMKEYITENRAPKNLPEIQAILNLEQRINNLYTQSQPH